MVSWLGFLWIVILTLADAVFLQPIKIVISFIVRFLWYPGVHRRRDILDRSDPNIQALFTFFERANVEKYENPELIKYYKSIHNIARKSIPHLADNGDGFKFHAIVEGITQNPERVESLLREYITPDGIICRHPIGHDKCKAAANFSGDMASGLLYLLSRMRNKQKDLSDACICAICKLFETTTFQWYIPNKKIFKFPMKFMHPDAEQRRIEDRGWVYTPIGLGPQIHRILTWYTLGYQYTGDRRYQFLYYFTLILFAPLLLVCNGDPSIFVKKYYLTAWYATHSSAYIYAALHEASDDKYISGVLTRKLERNLARMADRYQTNVEFTLLASKYGNRPVELPKIMYLVPKGQNTFPNDDDGSWKEYISLRGFKRKQYADTWLTPKTLGHPYIWENNPLKPLECDDWRREHASIDLYIAHLHLNTLPRPVPYSAYLS
jgi:hypothetical protein